MKIPKPILELINSRKPAISSSELCDSCNSNCCSGPGFAIYENVLLIYEKYLDGALKRIDFEFKHGLSFEEFIYEYFDRISFQNGSLIVFFPKTLTDSGELLSVPPWNYYNSRDYLQNRYGKRGCIFLRKNIKVNENDNGCLLHREDKNEELYAKPIDCQFLQCQSNKTVITPSSAESSLWFSLLDYHFPNSLRKFNEKYPGLPS